MNTIFISCIYRACWDVFEKGVKKLVFIIEVRGIKVNVI